MEDAFSPTRLDEGGLSIPKRGPKVQNKKGTEHFVCRTFSASLHQVGLHDVIPFENITILVRCFFVINSHVLVFGMFSKTFVLPKVF